MPRLIVLYNQPDDPEAFDAHYRDVHTPIVRAYPNLRELKTCTPEGVGGRPSPYYLMAEMTFDSQDDLNEALGSDAGTASARDLRNFATAGSVLFVAPDSNDA
ncbi:MAG: EthD family reductase [Chloroflexi bacterium]|nr:EthD family reductase [Chloroflexota bacterium]